MQSADRYSIDELHAYAKANNYPDEARSLHRYLMLRERSKPGNGARPEASRSTRQAKRQLR